MKVIISGKCHGYYPDNRLTLHSNLFIIGAQVSQFDLSRVPIICTMFNFNPVSSYSSLSPTCPLSSKAWTHNSVGFPTKFNTPCF